MLLYLARHAQTASSAVDSFNGRRELPLTERGQQQARKLGQRLSAVRFAAVYRSPLGRTAQTAGLIGKYRLRWPQDECALNLVELRAGRDPFLRLWNDTGHIDPDPAAATRAGK